MTVIPVVVFVTHYVETTHCNSCDRTIIKRVINKFQEHVGVHSQHGNNNKVLLLSGGSSSALVEQNGCLRPNKRLPSMRLHNCTCLSGAGAPDNKMRGREETIESAARR